MELLEVELPKKVLIGSKAIEKIGDICKELDLEGPVTLFTEPTILKIVGKEILETLESYGYDIYVRVLPKKIEMKHLLNLKDSDFTIGFGGGRIIDGAKMAAKKSKISFVSVPTAISHDGISNDRAVLDIYSVPAVMPSGIVIDTDIISKSPYRLTAAGACDMIAKLTAVADWELSHEQTGEYFSEYAATINRTAANLVIRSARSIKNLEQSGLRSLIEALVFSGIAMSIAGSSRPASGSEHLFSHALKILYPQKTSLHGEECALASIIYSYFHNMDWPRIIETLKIIEAPTNNEELKIPEKILIKALSQAKNIRSDRYTILNYMDIDEKMIKEAAKETAVIQ